MNTQTFQFEAGQKFNLMRRNKIVAVCELNRVTAHSLFLTQINDTRTFGFRWAMSQAQKAIKSGELKPLIADKLTASFEAEEWVEIEASTLQEAKAKYEEVYIAWQNAKQSHS